jgi:hypothetical protein
VATEVHAGKDPKQAVAIAYSEKERSGDSMEESYAPIKGSVSSLAELNLANQRLYGQLEGETTFPNTGDAGGLTATCPVCHKTCPAVKLPNGDLRVNCPTHGKSDIADSK